MEEEGYDTKSLSCTEGTIICVIAVGEERRRWHSLCGADFDFAIERKMMVEITVTAVIPFLNQVTGQLL